MDCVGAEDMKYLSASNIEKTNQKQGSYILTSKLCDINIVG